MDNPENLATHGTQDEEKQGKIGILQTDRVRSVFGQEVAQGLRHAVHF
jgi:hypothetical protein